MGCSSNNNKCLRKGEGRQKVEKVKIQSEKNFQVTVSKSRGGLFKKAGVETTDKLLEAHQRANLDQQTQELNRICHQLEIERKRAQELDAQRRLCGPNLDNLDYAKLVQLQKILLQFKDEFATRVYGGALVGQPSLSRPVSGPERVSGGPSLTTVGAITYGPVVGGSSVLVPYSSTPTHPHTQN